MQMHPHPFPRPQPASLCQLARDWRGEMPVAGYAVEEKVDGWRALYFRGLDGKPGLWTRNGMPINGAGHILHRLGLLERVAGQPLFLDGEFQVGGTLADTKAWCERGWKSGGEAGLFHAFDVVPIVNWERGGWEWPMQRRKEWLASLMRQAAADASLQWEWREGSRGRDDGREAVRLVEHGWAFGVDDIGEAAASVWEREGEGIMLKDPDAPYVRARSSAWLKVKAVEQFTRVAG